MPRRVYVTDQEIAKKRGIHTVYVGTTQHPVGEGSRVIATKFYSGVAKDVDENTYQRMKDLGHASEGRPRTSDDD